MILKSKSSKASQAIKCLGTNKQLFINKPLLDNSDGIEIQVANTKKLKEKSYQLMYEIYLDKGYIKENPTKMHFTEHDLLNETVILVAIKDQEVIGTMSIIPDNAYGLPAEKSYSQELKLLKQKNRICEISALGIKNDARFSTNILIKLFNASTIYTIGILNRSHYIITVNPRHTALYIKKLLFKVIGLEKEFEKVSGAPAVLLSMSLEEGEKVIKSNENTKRRRLLKYFVSINQAQAIIRKFKQ